MTKEQVILEVISTIRSNFPGTSIVQEMDEDTGEVFISVGSEQVYYGEFFREIVARIQTELLWPSGIFDVFFVAPDSSEVSQALPLSEIFDPIPNTEVVPGAAIWTTSTFRLSSHFMPFWEPDTAPTWHYLAPMSTGLSMNWEPSGLASASGVLTLAPNWHSINAYVAHGGHRQLDWQRFEVANQALIVKSLNFKISKSCDEKEGCEPWAA
jgi:hypothetical protein